MDDFHTSIVIACSEFFAARWRSRCH